MASLLEGLTWQKFIEISESDTTEGKYGIPRFDGSLHLLQEYSYRVRMRVRKEAEMDPGEVKKLGPLGLRLVEGLRGPALYIVKALKEDLITSEKGPEAIVQALVSSLRPRRQQEARELYLAGSREHGILSRQYGEPMSTYILRRKTWYAMLTDLDTEIKLPELLLAEQILMNANVSEEHQLMIRTSLSQVISVEGVCNELVNQHGHIHLREKKGPSPWRPRFGGKGGPPWKGKWKGQGFFSEEAGHDGWDGAYEGEAYLGYAEAGWDNHSQSLGGYEDETASGYYGSDAGLTSEYEYQEIEDPVLQVFAAMVADGLDENVDQESAEYASEIIQAEAEAFFVRQKAQAKGHTGFGGAKRYEVRGQLSLEERKARVTALKSRTTCRACGARGHWSGDSVCPKGGKGKGRPPSSSSTASTKGGHGKGKDKTGKGGAHKARTVYFAVREADSRQPQVFMTNNGDFTRVPPPADLCDSVPLVPPSSLDGVALTSLASMLSWSGRAEPATTQGAPSAPSSSCAAAASFSLPLPRTAATAPSTSAGGLLPAPLGSPPAATSVSSQWSLVPGKDWDHEMLFQALRVNSDVVMDQLLEQARLNSGQPTSGPMAVENPEDIPEPELRAVPLTGAYDLPLLRVGTAPSAGLEPTAGLTDAEEPEPLHVERPHAEATSSPPTVEQAACKHERTTTKGTNRYYTIRTCLSCRQVLERTKKEQATASSTAATRPLHEQGNCAHLHVSHAGTNHHVWKWYCKDCGLKREGRQSEASAASMGYGALGNRNLEGPDTAAVKVLEMAGTVVMVQESGGTPVPLSKLPGIVEKCAEIYQAKHGQPVVTINPTARSAKMPPPPAPTATTTATVLPKASGLRQDQGITGDTELQSGKHKGKKYGDVFEQFPDYVDWILSQGGNLQAASLQNFDRYIRARKIKEHKERAQANMAVDAELPCESSLIAVLDTGCNQTCHGALWMKDYLEASGLPYEPLGDSMASSLNGIGGKVRALGKRTLHIAIQLADGSLATGTVESTELEGSTAPLLMSCRAQKQLGFVLDLEEHTAYSKVFQQYGG